MADHARSEDPVVQAQLDRFAQLSPGRDILGLERITRLMELLGDPHLHLPPIFHVAGTNGKGSTCAFLRAGLEAAGYRVHAYTSPHLVRFNERIRLAGRLIEDAALAPLLAEVLDAAEADDLAPSFFEATTAAAFLAFSRTPADACIIEVGLGGRLDATNIIAHPTVCGIAALGIDHQAFLGNDPVQIAAEKAGIAKPLVPLVTFDYPAEKAVQIAKIAAAVDAPIYSRKSAWDSAIYQGQLHYRDEDGTLVLPQPRLFGVHQGYNAALAIAMLRHQSILAVPDAALRAAMDWVQWPARLQRLGGGPLTAIMPDNNTIWLDGCHNPAGAEAVAAQIPALCENGQKLHLVCGILENKDMAGILAPFLPHIIGLTAVPVGDHAHHAPAAIADWAQAAGVPFVGHAPDVETALHGIASSLPMNGGQKHHSPPAILIIGSLYLAGEVLKANGQLPD